MTGNTLSTCWSTYEVLSIFKASRAVLSMDKGFMWSHIMAHTKVPFQDPWALVTHVIRSPRRVSYPCSSRFLGICCLGALWPSSFHRLFWLYSLKLQFAYLGRKRDENSETPNSIMKDVQLLIT